MLAHLFAGYVASDFHAANVSAFLGTAVVFGLGFAVYWRVMEGPRGFPVDMSEVVTLGST